MGGGRIFPPGWLSLSNPFWMPQMGWFFMTLFLPISEKSWRPFLDFRSKISKTFSETVFLEFDSNGGPFYAKIKKVKKVYFSNSYFYNLNMNYTRFKLSFSVSDMPFNQVSIILRLFLWGGRIFSQCHNPILYGGLMHPPGCLLFATRQ